MQICNFSTLVANFLLKDAFEVFGIIQLQILHSVLPSGYPHQAFIIVTETIVQILLLVRSIQYLVAVIYVCIKLKRARRM